MLARTQHIKNIIADPEFELVTACDVDEEALRLVSEMSPQTRLSRDFNEVFADPEIDLVVIATTERFRIPLYQAAIKHGKPVYTEKPFAATLEECRTAAHELTEAGIPFCVGHNRRCSPAMVEAREIFLRHKANPQPGNWRFIRPGAESIDPKGEEGVPAMLVRLNDDWMSWKAVHMTKGTLNENFGQMLSEMTHFTDLCRWFLETEPVKVSAVSHGPINHSMIFSFENGALATLMVGSNGTFGYPKELLEIMAYGGIVVVDHMLEVRTAGIADAPARKTYPMLKDRHPEIGKEGGFNGWWAKKQAACQEAVAKGDPMLQFTAEPDKGHLRMLREFTRQIRGEREPVSPPMDAYLAARMCFAAIESVRQNRPVELSEMD